MKTFLLSLTLVLLTLQGSKAANVTSCLQCQTPDAGCAEGTGTGSPCGGKADGCFVVASTGEAEGQSYTAWVRGCCFASSCNEIHESQDVGGVSTRVNESW